MAFRNCTALFPVGFSGGGVLHFLHRDGQITATLNAALLLNRDSPEREAAKENLNDASLLSILTEEEGAFFHLPD